MGLKRVKKTRISAMYSVHMPCRGWDLKRQMGLKRVKKTRISAMYSVHMPSLGIWKGRWVWKGLKRLRSQQCIYIVYICPLLVSNFVTSTYYLDIPAQLSCSHLTCCFFLSQCCWHCPGTILALSLYILICSHPRMPLPHLVWMLLPPSWDFLLSPRMLPT